MTSDQTSQRLIGYVSDIWLALKGIAAELDAWNAAPASGRIFVNGVALMVAPPAPIDIPADNCPAVVQWYDKLDTAIPHSKTQTHLERRRRYGCDLNGGQHRPKPGR